MLGSVVYYAMRQHEVDALRDRKELAWTAFVAKTGSGLFRVPRPSVSSKWLMRNVGPNETSQELATQEENPPVEAPTATRKAPSQGAPNVKPKQTLPIPRSKRARHKWRARALGTIVALSVLAAIYYAWTYLRPLFRI